MNENAKKWVQELRSGKHKRAVNRLRRTDKNGNHSYCCLGLACELYRQSTGKGTWTETDLFKLGRNVEQAGLPPTVRKWLGIRPGQADGLVSLPPGHLFGNLAHANDVKGSSFRRVASIIEKDQGFLFVKDRKRP